jgi:hypothetical protein
LVEAERLFVIVDRFANIASAFCQHSDEQVSLGDLLRVGRAQADQLF